MFRRSILFYLSKLTLNWNLFSRVIHCLVVKIELPILSYIFILAGAVKVFPRHSVAIEGRFHPFLSDVDLSIFTQEQKIKRIMQIESFLGFIFCNLGEVEYYNEDEIELLELSLVGNGQKLWDKFYKIRKISWQKNKLNQPLDKYEKLKIERSLKNILTDLKQENFALNGNQIFKEYLGMLNIKKCSSVSLSQYSPFLELPICVGRIDNALYFEHAKEACIVMSFFPESDWVPESKEERDIKKVIIIKELLISLNNQRKNKLNAMGSDLVLDNWIIELREKLKNF